MTSDRGPRPAPVPAGVARDGRKFRVGFYVKGMAATATKQPRHYKVTKLAGGSDPADCLGLEGWFSEQTELWTYSKNPPVPVQVESVKASRSPEEGMTREQKADLLREFAVSDSQPRQAWIFQDNPAWFDLESALRECEEIDWSVSRFTDEIEPGDRAYLWQSGQAAGIYGVAEVLNEPDSRPSLTSRFVRAPERMGEVIKTRVYLRVLGRVEPFLAKQAIQSDTRLSGLSILQLARGTNFRVTPEEDSALNDLVSSRLSKPSSERRRCWWINQANNFSKESKGGYVWSPKVNKKDQPLPQYESMTQIQPGDVLLHYADSKIKAISKATSGAKDLARPGEEDAQIGNFVNTEYFPLQNPIHLSEIPASWRTSESGPFTATQGTASVYIREMSPNFARNLQMRFAGRWPSGSPWETDPIDQLVAHTNLDKRQIQELLELLEVDDKRQIILSGPPGSGKTWVADALARFISGNPLEGPPENARLAFVQFHQSYGYEDFVQGIRPSVTEDKSLTYEVSPGLLMRFRESVSGTEPFVMVIDEINRANVARVFGELLFLLEYRERAIELPYAKLEDPPFSIPRNMYFIGTMNTADRSLAQIDYALRRRFRFFRLQPMERGRARVLRRWLEFRDSIPQKTRETVVRYFESLNKQVEQEMGEDFQVGHSYFMNEDLVAAPNGLEIIWRSSLRPLLEEYFQNRKQRADLIESLSPQRLLSLSGEEVAGNENGVGEPAE